MFTIKAKIRFQDGSTKTDMFEITGSSKFDALNQLIENQRAQGNSVLMHAFKEG